VVGAAVIAAVSSVSGGSFLIREISVKASWTAKDDCAALVSSDQKILSSIRLCALVCTRQLCS
jgi:hypothetical protein